MSVIWRPITGYEGLYEVSNQGEIRSLPKTLNRHKTRPYATKMRLMTLRVGNKHGHLRVDLTGPGGVTSHWVHRLVALEFCHREPGQDYVLHGPNGPADNRASELRWGTAADNYADMAVHGTIPEYVPPTHCHAGHAMTPENVYVWSKRPTQRQCRECQRERQRRSDRRKRDDPANKC